MRIVKIIDQHRRDFRADFECELCGNIEKNKSGYDDAYFHNTVIPEMKCKTCGKTSGDDYVPMSTKYPDGFQV